MVRIKWTLISRLHFARVEELFELGALLGLGVEFGGTVLFRRIIIVIIT